ncbi:hypothetical protein J6590_054459 [Homalodisca vitripennis]|nr:hypothetical protein J6590_054459 [Homalodisca vitripennis]
MSKGTTSQSHVSTAEGEASSESASPVKVGRGWHTLVEASKNLLGYGKNPTNSNSHLPQQTRSVELPINPGNSTVALVSSFTVNVTISLFTNLSKVVGRITGARSPMIGFHPSMFQQSRQLIQPGPLLDIVSGEGGSRSLPTRHHFHHQRLHLDRDHQPAMAGPLLEIVSGGEDFRPSPNIVTSNIKLPNRL